MSDQPRPEPAYDYVAVCLYFRHGDAVAHTIQALREQTAPPRHIVLVDNASADGVIERLAATDALHGVQIVSLDVNGGYSRGMNAGAAAVADLEPHHLLFVTHEVRLAPTCAAELLNVCASAQASVVGPRLSLPSGAPWSLGGLVDWKGDAYHRTSSPGDEPMVSDWLDGSCLLVPRDHFLAVGGFDPSFFLYWEDVDMSYTLKSRGSVLCVPRACATQAPGAPPLHLMLRNRLLVWRKHDRRRFVLSLLEIFGRLVRRLPQAGSAEKRSEIRIFARALRDGLRPQVGEVSA